MWRTSSGFEYFAMVFDRNLSSTPRKLRYFISSSVRWVLGERSPDSISISWTYV
jgi:hypothetical protein